MGKRTYNQIVTELSPEQWPYGEVMTYILTHHSEEVNKKISVSGMRMYADWKKS